MEHQIPEQRKSWAIALRAIAAALTLVALWLIVGGLWLAALSSTFYPNKIAIEV